MIWVGLFFLHKTPPKWGVLDLKVLGHKKSTLRYFFENPAHTYPNIPLSMHSTYNSASLLDEGKKCSKNGADEDCPKSVGQFFSRSCDVSWFNIAESAILLTMLPAIFSAILLISNIVSNIAA